MLSSDELWEKCATDETITREDLGILTPATPNGLQVLSEGFNFMDKFSAKSLRKTRIKQIYNVIRNNIELANYYGQTMYAYDYPNAEVPEEVIKKLQKQGFNCEFCEETKHWHFKW